MKHRLFTGVVVLGLMVMVGCAGQAPEDFMAEDYGEIGADIYLQPEEAEHILSGAGLSPDEFQESLREISADPEQARRYRWAFERRRIAAGELPDYESPQMGAPPGGGPGGF